MRLFLLTTLTMIAFAANSLLNRMALAGELIDPASFAMIRVVAGAVVLMVLLMGRDKRLFDPSGITPTSVLALCAYILGFSFAYLTLDAGIGALILFGGVQITMFAGALITGEKSPLMRWIGAGIALAGLALLFRPSLAAPDMLGAVLMAVAAIGWGIYSLKGRIIGNPLQATGANFLLAVPVVLVGWLLFGFEVSIQTSGILLAIISGALTSGLGYALWYSVLPRLDATVAAVAQLTVPVIAMAGGVAFLGEGVSLQVILASCLVLSGVAISLRK